MKLYFIEVSENGSIRNGELGRFKASFYNFVKTRAILQIGSNRKHSLTKYVVKDSDLLTIERKFSELCSRYPSLKGITYSLLPLKDYLRLIRTVIEEFKESDRHVDHLEYLEIAGRIKAKYDGLIKQIMEQHLERYSLAMDYLAGDKVLLHERAKVLLEELKCIDELESD